MSKALHALHDMQFYGDKGSFNIELMWNNTLVKWKSISIQNYKIIFSGWPFDDFCHLLHPNYLIFIKEFHCGFPLLYIWSQHVLDPWLSPMQGLCPIPQGKYRHHLQHPCHSINICHIITNLTILMVTMLPVWQFPKLFYQRTHVPICKQAMHKNSLLWR